MADNYKILAQATAASVEEINGQNQANVIYTVPANTQAAISSISLINSSNTAETYYVGVATESEAQTLNEVVSPLKFISIGSSNQTFNKTIYSSDGISWTSGATLPFVYTYVNPTHAAYGNGKFVAGPSYPTTSISSLEMAYSDDGITWNLGSSSSIADLIPGYSSQPQTRGIAYGNNLFVGIIEPGVGSDKISTVSSDGINWQNYLVPFQLYFGSLVYGNGKFAVTFYEYNNGIHNLYYSEDGITWTASLLPTTQNTSWPYSLAYLNNMFYAVSPYGVLYYSSNLIEPWTSIVTFPSGVFVYNLAYGNGKYIAIPKYNQNGYAGTDFVMYSSDGFTWSQAQLPLLQIWGQVAYADGKFVASAYRGFYQFDYTNIFIYSTDGITWTVSTLPETLSWGTLVTNNRTNGTKELINPSNIIIPVRSIEPNTVDEITGGITLSAGDQIRVYSESTDLIVQVYGVEIA